jgi:release factor glutamine methyltransferase
VRDWKVFFQTHQDTLLRLYPGLTLERFVREALEIDGDEEAFLRGIPFAYQLGYTEFAGLDLKVTPDVLIPRPETEYLVELVNERIKLNPDWRRLLDIGTGSGCLGLSLKFRQPHLETWLSDISQPALDVAETNAYHHQLEVKLLRSDLLDQIAGLFDLIVTNPPYIPRSHEAHKQTHEFEPHLALYIEDDQYEFFFTKLFSQAARHLCFGGEFWMEGFSDQLNKLIELAQKSGLRKPEIINDLTGRARYLKASAPLTPLGN